MEFICPVEMKSCVVWFAFPLKFWEICSDQGSGVRGSSQTRCESCGALLLLILQPFN